MLEQSYLFKKLKKLEKKEFELKSKPISSKIVEELIPQSRDILSRIPQYLPEYTLHDIQHSIRVLNNIENILPKDIDLNIIEIQLILYAVFLHDIGMTSDKEEERFFNNYTKEANDSKKEELLLNYVELMKKKTNINEDILQKYRKTLINELFFYKELYDGAENEDIYSEYIRKRHVNRAELKLLLMTQSLGFEYKYICLMNHIFTIILSHGVGFDDLSNEKIYPIETIISDKNVNILFLCILLRLGDLLDASISRTPKYIYKLFGFSDKISISKWEKNLLMVGQQITNYRISFNYLSTKPDYERTIRKFIKFIEEQIFNSIKVLRYSNKKINLSPNINLIVNNDGSYKSADKEITIEYEKVKNVLMGIELYSDSTVFIRELIQNSRDACKMREFYSKKLDIHYIPKIVIDFDEKEKIFTIIDNGIGMNQKIVNNYLIKIGSSSYSEKDFYEKFSFHPIGNFGIGIFSVFMAAEYLDIDSIRFSNSGFFSEPISLRININEKFVIDKNIDNKFHLNEGTSIKLKITNEFLEKEELNKDKIVKIIKNMISTEFDIPIYYKTIENKVNIEEIFDSECYTINEESFKLNFSYLSNERDLDKTINQISYNGIIIDKNVFFNHGILSNCFKINYELKINGLAKLSLNASRDKFIENSEYNKFVKLINEKLSEFMYEKSEYKYLSLNFAMNNYSTKQVINYFLEQIKVDVNEVLFSIKELKDKYKTIYIKESKFKYSINETEQDFETIIINEINEKDLYIEYLLNNYIEEEEIIIKDNKIFTKLIISKEEIDREDELKDILIRTFTKFNDTDVLFIFDKVSPLNYKINLNHHFGKKLRENIDNISLFNHFIVLGQNIKNIKIKKNSIPDRFLNNANPENTSKKSLKFYNKIIKKICNNLKIKEFEINKNNFINIEKIKSQ